MENNGIEGIDILHVNPGDVFSLAIDILSCSRKTIDLHKLTELLENVATIYISSL